MSLSFTVTVTRCGECPHCYTYKHGVAATVLCSKECDSEKALKTYRANFHTLTATGPYACPMLKQIEQEDDDPDCPIHGKTDGGDCPRC